ncbi:MAG: GWxTD domain-containing protein [Acidobacteriota bacterium]|nr:GWxTD domain-containing protein [Acidobacteriota bacterium]
MEIRKDLCKNQKTAPRSAMKKALTGALAALFAGLVMAASSPRAALAHGQSQDNENGKLTRQEKRRLKAIRKETMSPYRKWISGPIGYIITPSERAAFKKLTTDDEREQFIENFWERRNPNPGDPENEYKEEFYRRIAYANEHYASGIPGWRTDRGRIYIMYGPPDEQDNHDAGGTYVANPGELPYMGPGASNQMTTYPFEDWYYHYIPGIGENVKLEFVDPTMTGEFRLTMNPCEKDAMAEVPNDTTGCQGGASIGAIYNPNTVMPVPNGMNASINAAMPESMNEFTQLDTYAKIFQPPAVKFNDLKALVTHHISAQLLPFNVRTDFIRLTEESVLVPITVQVQDKDLEFQNKNGVMHASMDIFGQLSTLSGRVASTFEQTMVLDVPKDEFAAYESHRSVYQHIVPLRPGRYKLTIVLKDDNSGHMGSTAIGEIVPDYPDDTLESSSLILADLLQQVPTTDVGTGPFVIGSTKVRPSVGDTFTQSQDLGLYMQVYNLGVNPKTHRPNAEIEYNLMQNGKSIFSSTEQAADIKNASSQLTIEKTMPLKPLAPGDYTVAVKVTDNIKKKTINNTASFVVQK